MMGCFWFRADLMGLSHAGQLPIVRHEAIVRGAEDSGSDLSRTIMDALIMMVKQHTNAMITPKIRRYIRESDRPIRQLAQSLG